MTIWVDDMRREGQVRGGGRSITGRWSHLMADDPAELAEFVASLGLRPEWIQQPGTPREHYDIVAHVRRRAIADGAVPISYPLSTGNLIATKRLQASALDAAGRGWHVFPLRPGTKVPAVRHWEHEATTDTEQIKQLWTPELRRRDRWYVPEPRNVGIACGPSGLIVLDLDLAKPGQDRSRWPAPWRGQDIGSGAEVLAALAEQAGQTVPETYAVATPSGGRHLYFTAPHEVLVRNSTGRPGPMIDIRGQGGYVVAAGSRLHLRPDCHDASAVASDLAYRLVHDVQPVGLPDWLTDAATVDRQRADQAAAGRSPRGDRDQSLSSPRDSYGAAALRGESDRVRSAPVGQRNHTLNAAAYSLGQLIAAGAVHRARAVEVLTEAAEAAGLEPSEIASTIDSGLSAGLQRPRALPERRSPPERSTTVGSRNEAGRSARLDRMPGGPLPLPAETAPAEAPRNNPDLHKILDAAIEQAGAAVAQLEATRADGQHPSYTRASNCAGHNDRPAYGAEPKVAR